ncbi:MAG TPA: hypothetical protein ENL18_02760 [Thermoplasmatales archaeon]|nr:hypothetical protein [Thermoplasmatales archaeon]
MREYSIKKGHKPDLDAILKKYFGVEGDIEKGLDFVADGIGEVHFKKEKNAVLIETRPIPGMLGGADIIKKWNDFLFDVTERTVKERKKLLEKEAKK